ncbi:unnamed protein product [Nippostrongylus brasiliensis]|uniref:Uncharacterized protein n=1 Tax=Nippostrongylus brasiliensis TaxID=27835 RepID=A0A0N4XRL0_NIPBR|nr:unnamed protein product [Nippostrongylus brasiliensis]
MAFAQVNVFKFADKVGLRNCCFLLKHMQLGPRSGGDLT